jgi:tetratricopeptide (TPR) repeat protein
MRALIPLISCICLLQTVQAQDAVLDQKKQFNAAFKHYQTGAYSKARSAFQKLYKDRSQDQPRRRKSAYFIGLCLENEQKYEEAIEWFKSLIKAFPKSQTARNAQNSIDSLIQYSGGNFDKLRLQTRSRALIDNEKYSEALKELATVVLPLLEAPGLNSLKDEDRELYFLLGECHRNLENYSDAAKAYNSAALLGIPEAGEFRDRSLRYIVRSRLVWGAIVILLVLCGLLLRQKAWRTNAWAQKSRFGMILGFWFLIGLLLWILGWKMDIGEDIDKPIFPEDIAMMVGVLSLPIGLTLLYSCSLGNHTSFKALKIGVFGAAASLSTMALILHFKDWFMLLSL